MSKPYSLIVTDTSPLFTLALAGSLEVLLRPGLPVRIPDAVFFEATRVHGAPGAEQIVEWINAHLDMVQIVPTDIKHSPANPKARAMVRDRLTKGIPEQHKSTRWQDAEPVSFENGMRADTREGSQYLQLRAVCRTE